MTWTRSFGPSGNDEAQRSVALVKEGLVLDVIIRPDEHTATNNPGTVAEMRVGAMVDTGASKICIDHQIAEQLNLREIDQTTLKVVTQTLQARVYMGVIEIPELDHKEVVELIAPNMGHLDKRRFRALLGRSVLSRYILTYDGPSGQVHFTKRVHDVLLPYDYG